MHFKCERQPLGWVLAHKLSHTTKTAHHLDALFLKYGDPAGYCVLAGKRNKQAKDKQLSLATIVWSKVQFMTCNVPKAHIAPKVHRFCKRQKHRIIAFTQCAVKREVYFLTKS